MNTGQSPITNWVRCRVMRNLRIVLFTAFLSLTALFSSGAGSGVLMAQDFGGKVIPPGGVTDSLSARFFGRDWSATKFWIDTVSEVLMTNGSHGFMYRFVGAYGGDTIFLRFPTITVLPNDASKSIFGILPSTNKNTSYKFATLDTGWYDVDLNMHLDYTPGFDVELHTAHLDSSSEKSGKYYSCLANHFKPTGKFHLLHLDSHYLSGTFYCDISETYKDPAVHITNGYFRMSFLITKPPLKTR